jgi:hypothetical protein
MDSWSVIRLRPVRPFVHPRTGDLSTLEPVAQAVATGCRRRVKARKLGPLRVES